MDRLYLLAEAGGARFAIPANEVDSVVPHGEIVHVPLAEPHISGLSALRSRVITVVDVRAAIEGGQAMVGDEQPIVVVLVDGHLYGLAVDEVHDVVENGSEEAKLGAAFKPGWQRVSIGVIEIAGSAIVVLDPASLVRAESRKAA